MVEAKTYRTILNLIQKEMDQELLRLLDFWEKEVVDVDTEGFVGQIDHFGNKNIEAPKGIIWGQEFYGHILLHTDSLKMKDLKLLQISCTGI